MLECTCTVKICISVDSDGKVSEMTRCKLTHIRAALAYIEEFDPVFIQRILIPYMGTDFHIGRLTLGIPSLEIVFGYLSILDKYVVIKSVITVKDGHKAQNLGTVSYMVRSVARLTLSVNYGIDTASYHYERTAYEVVHHRNSLGGDT